MKNKCDLVVDEIMKEIYSGSLVDGKKLPNETELTERFSVSRVTIRESIKKLSMMGVVNVIQGSGTFVKKITPSTFMKPLFPLLAYEEENINEIYDTRSYVETGCAGLAAVHRKDFHIKKLDSICNQMDSIINIDDKGNYTKLDKMFHMCIGEAANNKMLFITLGIFYDIYMGFIDKTNHTVKIMTQSLKYHRFILEAIMRKNQTLAEILMKEHIMIAKENLIKCCKDHH